MFGIIDTTIALVVIAIMAVAVIAFPIAFWVMDNSIQVDLDEPKGYVPALMVDMSHYEVAYSYLAEADAAREAYGYSAIANGHVTPKMGRASYFGDRLVAARYMVNHVAYFTFNEALVARFTSGGDIHVTHGCAEAARRVRTVDALVEAGWLPVVKL